MQIVKVKGWGKADVTSAAIAAYLNDGLQSDEQPRAANIVAYFCTSLAAWLLAAEAEC